MNAPAAMIFLAFGFGLGIVLCLYLNWREERRHHRLSNRSARAIARGIERQMQQGHAEIEGEKPARRAHVHAGDQRASLERT